MVLVHGSLQDHTISAALVAELRAGLTAFALDRRGFGASGDGADYAIEREFEDVAAVVDAVAERVGGPVAVWGHSYGASVAMGAAALTGNVSHLVLYEPSLGLAYPEGWIDTLEKTLGEGDDEAAIVLVLRDVLEFTDDQIEAMRSGAEWARRVAVAPTVAREARAEDGWVYRPRQFSGITARTLLLSGLGEHAGDQAGHGRGRGGDRRSEDPRARRSRAHRSSDRPGNGRDRDPRVPGGLSAGIREGRQRRSRSCSIAYRAAAARVEVPILA